MALAVVAAVVVVVGAEAAVVGEGRSGWLWCSGMGWLCANE